MKHTFKKNFRKLYANKQWQITIKNLFYNIKKQTNCLLISNEKTMSLPSRKQISIFIYLFIASNACNALPIVTENKTSQCEQIESGMGPEDFVLQRSKNRVRILVSSHDRRAWDPSGDIYAIDIESNIPGQKLFKKYKLNRINEPKNFSFRPHGMDILQTKKADLLYVVTHGAQINDNDQTISIYRIFPDSLTFLYSIRSALLTSPNDVAVLPDGSIFASNDAKSRGSMTEVMLSLKNADVVYCPLKLSRTNSNLNIQGNGKCKIAASNLAMPNGVLIKNKDVYISTTRENLLYRYKNNNGILQNKTKIAELVGQDNLFWIDEDNFLMAIHPSSFSFMRHQFSGENPSPTVIYKINAKTGKKSVIFSDDGKRIPAGTGAFVYNKNIYISQVFENFILKCNFDK